MTCQERLSHAIYIDTILIYPDKTLVVEGIKSRNVTESHGDRLSLKYKNNPYSMSFDSRPEHAAIDDVDFHDKKAAE